MNSKTANSRSWVNWARFYLLQYYLCDLLRDLVYKLGFYLIMLYILEVWWYYSFLYSNTIGKKKRWYKTSFRFVFKQLFDYNSSGNASNFCFKKTWI